jgi:hypothetical protein
MYDVVLNWEQGAGWLVFSGGNTALGTIRAQALSRAFIDGHVVYISLASDGGDALLDDMEDLGAPTGYMVDIQHEDDETIYEQIHKASVIVIEVDTSLDALYEVIQGMPLRAIKVAYERGAVVLVEGLAINVFGKWVISDTGQILSGVNWIHDVFLEPDSEGAVESRAVQTIMSNYPEAIAVNIGVGSAIAFGSQRQVEIWGERKVTLSLGQQYTNQQDAQQES